MTALDRLRMERDHRHHAMTRAYEQLHYTHTNAIPPLLDPASPPTAAQKRHIKAAAAYADRAFQFMAAQHAVEAEYQRVWGVVA